DETRTVRCEVFLVQPVVVGTADRRVQLRVAGVHRVESERGEGHRDVDAVRVHSLEPRRRAHDLVRLHAPRVFDGVSGLRQAGETLALAVRLRIEATFHGDADAALAIPHEPRRLRAQGGGEVALPEVVRLQQVAVAI